MRQLLRVLDRTAGHQEVSLPLLATASDVRGVVQYLKKKASGVTIGEAVNAIKKQVFDPRKVIAYESLGIIQRAGDRLTLSPLGWELARQLEPETEVFRAMLNNIEPYRSVLEWSYHQKTEVLLRNDVAAYWRERYPQAMAAGAETTVESNVICFFQLCQAAALGTHIIGTKGQPTRLRVDRAELQSYLKTVQVHYSKDGYGEGFKGETERKEATMISPDGDLQTGAPTPHIPEKVRVLISRGKDEEIANRVQAALDLADFESQIVEREAADTAPIPSSAFQAMRQCYAGIIVVTGDDFREDQAGEYVLKESVQVEIWAAYALYDRRVVLLWDKRAPVPTNLQSLCYYTYEGVDLTWSAGVQLVKAIKNFKNNCHC